MLVMLHAFVLCLKVRMGTENIAMEIEASVEQKLKGRDPFPTANKHLY